MSNEDTVKLLKECDAGSKMAVESIKEVLIACQDNEMHDILQKYLEDHKKLGDEYHNKLKSLQEDDKEPNPIAEAMSWMKTNFKLAVGSDVNMQIADVITDGCDMGIKSLSKYINKYKNASDDAKALAKRLIDIEENFRLDVRKFL